ncbi:MAG TPA: SDR family oxidoreductase [Acidimicrobiales bacterium]|jgi:retinol dehydrogenase-14|nr:SDR family oxidoreductase [Acidimicrobiales bacterium]
MSMHGKVVVVTGSNVGIGLETAVGVAERGATTILACRNQAKADAAAKEVTRRTWNDDVHVVALDLADLASVRKAADDIQSGWARLDVLVNNAGGTWSQRQHTAQGIEYTFGVNHLGPFYLTNLLLERLRADAPARVVSVSSVGHHAAFGGMNFDDLQSERRYEGMEAYCRSKLANVLFVRQLARRLQGTGVTANAAHPGWVRSSFGMDGDTTGVTGFGMRMIRPVQISPRRGAKTSVFLAASPDVAGKSGMYWVRSKPGHMSRHARDDAAAERLWDESEQLLAAAGFAVA